MKLKVEQVAVLIDTSVNTINNWYRFKKQNPEHELSQMLPEVKQDGDRQTRYWESSDIPALIEFKLHVPKGRNGFMGSVTQKYYHKDKKERKHGKKKLRTNRTKG